MAMFPLFLFPNVHMNSQILQPHVVHLNQLNIDQQILVAIDCANSSVKWTINK